MYILFLSSRIFCFSHAAVVAFGGSEYPFHCTWDSSKVYSGQHAAATLDIARATLSGRHCRRRGKRAQSPLSTAILMLDMTVMLPATGHQRKQSRRQGGNSRGSDTSEGMQKPNATGMRPEAASNDSLEKEQAVVRQDVDAALARGRERDKSLWAVALPLRKRPFRGEVFG
jgi:hypothetical protein